MNHLLSRAITQTFDQLFFWSMTLSLFFLIILFNTTPVRAQTWFNALSELGGIQTVRADDKKALTYAYSNLSDTEMDKFTLGKSFFNIPWVEAPSATTARDGLGPLFNANSCVSCHPGNGAGIVHNDRNSIHRSMVFRISRNQDTTSSYEIKQGFVADPVYGSQLNINAVHGVLFEGKPEVKYTFQMFEYPDGETVLLRSPIFSFSKLNYGELSPTTTLAPRLALSLTGLGEIEKIPAQAILANEDIHDANQDGISGKANRVYNFETQQWQLGRFARKASSPTVKQQVAQAMHHDMGLTSPLIPMNNCTSTQVDCLSAVRKGEIDVPMQRLDAVTFYITHLKIPAQRQAEQHYKGAQLFEQIGCSSCHKPSFITEDNNTIYPFSDFLLHDMGEGLSEQGQEYLAQGQEWRTTPLWGIGLAKERSKQAAYLHDGRATTVEEAILWHGGEAESAKNQFKQLTRTERQHVIKFLRSI